MPSEKDLHTADAWIPTPRAGLNRYDVLVAHLRRMYRFSRLGSRNVVRTNGMPLSRERSESV